MEVQPEEGGVRVKRELESGWFQWVRLPMPRVTIQSGIQSASLRDPQRDNWPPKEKRFVGEGRRYGGLTADAMNRPSVNRNALICRDRRNAPEFIEGTTG